jgi:hypothetical protein
MTKFADVPFRKWNRDGRLVETKVGQDVMKIAYKAMAEGKAVEMWQSQPVTPVPSVGGSRSFQRKQTYDTITVEISD